MQRATLETCDLWNIWSEWQHFYNLDNILQFVPFFLQFRFFFLGKFRQLLYIYCNCDFASLHACKMSRGSSLIIVGRTPRSLNPRLKMTQLGLKTLAVAVPLYNWQWQQMDSSRSIVGGALTPDCQWTSQVPRLTPVKSVGEPTWPQTLCWLHSHASRKKWLCFFSPIAPFELCNKIWIHLNPIFTKQSFTSLALVGKSCPSMHSFEQHKVNPSPGRWSSLHLILPYSPKSQISIFTKRSCLKFSEKSSRRGQPEDKTLIWEICIYKVAIGEWKPF